MTARICFLYPGRAAEDDYAKAEKMIDADVEFEVVHTDVPEDVHRADALRMIGDMNTLQCAIRMVDWSRFQAVLWACTSGSFVFGWDGARRQADELTQATTVPASSTSIAFVNALHAVEARRVAIAATYPPPITRLLSRFLTDAGFIVDGTRSCSIMTGREVGELARPAIVEIASEWTGRLAGVDALLLPDTAMHTVGLNDELEQAVGIPVLTANQVTIWEGLTLVGMGSGIGHGLGRLFRSRGAPEAAK